jgi:hypothetical protein
VALQFLTLEVSKTSYRDFNISSVAIGKWCYRVLKQSMTAYLHILSHFVIHWSILIRRYATYSN